MASLSTPGQRPSPFVSSYNSDDLSPRGFQFRESSVCPRLKAASDGGPTGLQDRGWSGRQAQAAPRWSGRAGGQVGCSAQAWGGVQEHTRVPQGAEWLPRGPGTQTELLPAGLFCSGILAPTAQGQDTHEEPWLQRGRGGPEITKPWAAAGVWTWAPERPGPVLPEASLPHGRWGWLGGPPRFLQEPGAGLSSYVLSPGRPPGLALTRQPAQTFRARLRGQPLWGSEGSVSGCVSRVQ